MILNLVYYTNKNFYISNQVKSIFIYLLSRLNTTHLYIKSFYQLVNFLTFIIDKANIYIKKSLSCI